MKERPVLFSRRMVHALVADAKSQTRRLVKPALSVPASAELDGITVVDGRSSAQFRTPWTEVVKAMQWNHDPARGTWAFEYTGRACPYGAPGDRLWVREAWAPEVGGIVFAADHDSKEHAGVERWKPGIHLRRVDARLVLEVTSVRVERLQDISEDDAKAEGVGPEFEIDVANFVHGRAIPASTHRLGFKHLWNEINGKRAPWDSNPWLWVIGFRRLP